MMQTEPVDISVTCIVIILILNELIKPMMH